MTEYKFYSPNKPEELKRNNLAYQTDFEMKKIQFLFLLIITLSCSRNLDLNEFSASHKFITSVGRFELLPNNNLKTWASGTYITFSFAGDFCEVTILDEVKYGSYHNIISIIVDGGKAQKVFLKDAENSIKIKGLNSKKKNHSVLICKNTEAAIGFIEFVSINCKKLLKQTQKSQNLIEFIGDSITCGFGNDCTEKTKNKGKWYEKHNAYFSFGPIVARKFSKNWLLTSVSGIGLTRSCCGTKSTLPQIYDKINLGVDGENAPRYKSAPKLICITLGQNDGFQKTDLFVSTYFKFVQKLKSRYPTSKIICCSSPMATRILKDHQERNFNKLAQKFKINNFQNTYLFFYKGIYRKGYLFHPTIQEHKKIAAELIDFITEKEILN